MSFALLPLLAALAGSPPPPAPPIAQVEGAKSRRAGKIRARTPEYKELVSLEDFIVALEPHGEWLVNARWGRCWKPRGVGPTWQPYYKGRWAHTEEGWYWVSDDPWAWATYHFGRWFLDPLVGWSWVPGKRWAPAWVSWRAGNGLVGWTPIGPDGKSPVLHLTFVPQDRLQEPVEEVVIPPARLGNAIAATRPLEAPRRPLPPRPLPPGPPLATTP